MRQHTGSRPHVQGSGRALRVRHSARNLTDGGGLVLVRKLFDRFALAGWIDRRGEREKGFFRPGLMAEVWITLLLYGGRVMDDLPLLERRNVRRIFGWTRVPDPTTFGRWLRLAAERMVPLLDELLWRMVRQRWALAGGAPKKLTLVMDSTVVVRYGKKQAGAERGYNPKKRGRPSHHPLVAFVRETGDCLGVRWRGGSAHTAEGAEEWLEELAGRLRGAGVRDITVRLDKGFFSREMVRTLERGPLLPAQGSPPRLAGRLPGPVALLGQGRSRLSGRGSVDGDGHALGRASPHGSDHAARRVRGSAAARHLRGPAPGGRADQHRWRPRPDRVAPLQQGRRGRAADRGACPATADLGRQDGGRRHRANRPRWISRSSGCRGASATR